MRKRLEVDERRQQLLELGIEVFGERSVEEVSVDDIAARAGISKGLLYHYFRSKRAYLVAVLDHVESRLGESVEAALSKAAESPLARVQGAVRGHIDLAAEHPQAYALLLRGAAGLDDELSAIIERSRARLAELVLNSLGGSTPPPLLGIAVCGWVGFLESATLDWVERNRTGRGVLERTELLRLLTGQLMSVLTAAGQAIPLG